MEFGQTHIQRLTQNRYLRIGGEAGQGRERERGEEMRTDLRVRIDVPEVKTPFSVHTGKDSWVGGAPLNIVDILTVVLKRAERGSSLALREGGNTFTDTDQRVTHCQLLLILQLGTPQFDGPVEGGGEEEMREVHLPSAGSVGADSCNWTMVTIKLYCETRLTAVTLALWFRAAADNGTHSKLS